MKTINLNPLHGMSEKESRFLRVWSSVLGSFLILLIGGAFYFYRSTIVIDAVQNKRIEEAEKKIDKLEDVDKYFPSNGEFQRAVRGVDLKTQANAAEIEMVKKNVREDLKDIDKKIDRLIEMQLDDRRTAKN